ncbi:MAG TPA: 50S ribosomal protein L4 [Candidatus Kapabacteria bacterium]|jgi:large subunit ribosomal protein L4|nr:50S ribosomal protein L4 [Ignavibacteria bacterium]HRE57430.1 50S ribosomal protein L4 [Candidatus Kapabacteria bacterium]HRK58081.1 50S ribosomal protein L4 [Candidatus Kapabacteria bacterium]
MQIDVYTIDGQKSGTMELPDDIFNVEPHEHAMHLAVKVYLANQRQGTHKTKTRTEVSGGGKKPWKQKGRGTARSGSSRSPIWVGGGTIHGPKPHKYTLGLPKKVKRLARKSALSLRVKENNLMVVDDFSFDTIKTKRMAEVIKKLRIENEKTLLLLPVMDENVILSARNIAKFQTMQAENASAYDILNHKKIVLCKSSVQKVIETF